MITNNYKNKYFSILGDSISTLEGYNEPKNALYYDTARKIAAGIATSLDTWWGQVIERLGGQLLVNNAWSGSTVCWDPAYEVESYACSDERTSALRKDGVDPDVIMVYMGTNDWGQGRRVFPDKAENENSTAVFSVAYATMLKKLKNNYPKAEIWCITLPISRCSAKEKFEFPYFCSGGHISEYCQAIRDGAAKYNCKVIDLYNYHERHDTLDGYHPNANGMQTLANGVLEALQNE